MSWVSGECGLEFPAIAVGSVGWDGRGWNSGPCSRPCDRSHFPAENRAAYACIRTCPPALPSCVRRSQTAWQRPASFLGESARGRARTPAIRTPAPHSLPSTYGPWVSFILKEAPASSTSNLVVRNNNVPRRIARYVKSGGDRGCGAVPIHLRDLANIGLRLAIWRYALVSPHRAAARVVRRQTQFQVSIVTIQ